MLDVYLRVGKACKKDGHVAVQQSQMKPSYWNCQFATLI